MESTNTRISRRETLLRCAALGSLTLASSLGLMEAVSAFAAQERGSARRATQWNEIGPFYKRLSPNNPKLRMPNDPGLPLNVNGRIFDTRGDILVGAKIEIW